MLFFYGTLRHRPLLEAVIGRDPGELRPGRLPGHEARWVEGHNFPLIRRGTGEAEGLLFEPEPGDVERLDAYEGGFVFRTAEVTVETDAGPVQAEVYFPAGESFPEGPPFDLDVWRARWGEMAVDAAAELVRRFDRGEPLQQIYGHFPAISARAWARRLAARGSPATVRQAGNPMEVTREHRGFEGFFRFRHLDLRHRQFDGSMTPEFTRECFVGFDAALVLPYDPSSGEVLLIEQLRLAAALRGDPNPVCLEPVAGLIEAGEEPEDCARRETLEEARLELRELISIGGIYPSPGYSTEYHHCFLGLADLSGADRRLAGAEDEMEDIRTHVMTLEAALDLFETGEVNVAPLAMMLHWLWRHRDRYAAAS
ncbi:NUDIX domain-containing protein [Histidinibacterium aquaticum]|uniref:ADP-ribose pyrophosphatase n=1 Tax=Histidinibacterium aquaticum TaxID=2613962 RepID=A0A5J5GPZ2_9RHOB|nr:NUDIX domain-containing protein [Histidinibacterium aquaticum]KAA9009823.1 NUDIX domain-containing protein [Histidinibacterium aquaticum]